MQFKFNVSLNFSGVSSLTNREQEILLNRIESVLIENGEKISDLVYGKYDAPLVNVEQIKDVNHG